MSDDGPRRLAGFSIYTSKDKKEGNWTNEELCFHDKTGQSHIAQERKINCKKSIEGRYVVIYNKRPVDGGIRDASENAILELCEVDVPVDDVKLSDRQHFCGVGGGVIQRIVGVSVGTDCAPFLADVFLYSYGAGFIRSLVFAGGGGAWLLTLTSLADAWAVCCPSVVRGSRIASTVSVLRILGSGAAGTGGSASCLDVVLSCGTGSRMGASLCGRHDDFGFGIAGFPFLSGGIPSSPACGVFVSQLIRYDRAGTGYTDLVLGAGRLSDRLLGQGCVCGRLASSLGRFCGGGCGELVVHCGVPLSGMVDGVLTWAVWAIQPEIVLYVFRNGNNRM
ncbi:hypothetical protein FSP39_017576 [Pinctada imbricata]|uniref:Uncharacterized protein n=1 Tax=Pinctada imbricata TaxID=66713 RepID=A0AA88XRS8_PINIB|nr:hypothetical protein FSP39_017576 [Pinctada imbricata]